MQFNERVENVNCLHPKGCHRHIENTKARQIKYQITISNA